MSASLFACSKHDELVIPVVEDSVLTANVNAALAVNPDTKGLNLVVAAHSGVVELSGSFDSYPKLDRALALTCGVTGVKSVDDKTVKKDDAATATPVAAVFVWAAHIKVRGRPDGRPLSYPAGKGPCCADVPQSFAGPHSRGLVAV